jgi:glutamate N-acetyltransferase/amino-acid N-acetyltransferase
MAGSELKIGSKSVKIGAAVKGAGMIDPNMATMLAFFTTDLNIKKGVLYGIFKECIDDTFNSITVDGASAMSTNDTSVIFANGLAENDTLSACQLNKFQETLFLVCKKLASDIIKGAEGATKTIVITVKNAMDKLNAKLAARSIAESNLVKTAVYGRCPNWGRIIQALGSSEKPDLSKDTVIKVNNFIVFKNQTIINIKNGRGLMSKDTIQIEIDLKKGKDSYTVTTCDLTKKYVDINSAY